MAGPSNQIDWGSLLGAYNTTQQNDRAHLLQQQADRQAADRARINQALEGIDSSIYADVGRGVSGDITKAPGYDSLIDSYNQHMDMKNQQAAKASWESMFKNPYELATDDQKADPWASVNDQLQKAQSNANQEAQKAWTQKLSDEKQRNQQNDDNITGKGFLDAWDKWTRANPDDPNMGAGYNTGQLTNSMKKSQQDWRNSHNGSLEGWYTSPAGTYYSRKIGGYSPQTYNYDTGATTGFTTNSSGYGGYAGTVYPSDEEDPSSNNPNSANAGTGGF